MFARFSTVAGERGAADASLLDLADVETAWLNLFKMLGTSNVRCSKTA
jgi:hypothetical protein